MTLMPSITITSKLTLQYLIINIFIDIIIYLNKQQIWLNGSKFLAKMCTSIRFNATNLALARAGIITLVHNTGLMICREVHADGRIICTCP